MVSEPVKQLRPLRRVEYDKLIELGYFQDEHIELLEGLLVPMSPIGPPHNATVQRLGELLLPSLLGRALVFSQGAFAALDFSEPEPDIAIVPLGDYQAAHPDRAHLIIEVAESSLAVDRGVKLRLYAQCNVPEYWIVNLVERHIEVYTEPSGETYAKAERFDRTQSIRLQHFPELELRVADIVK
ncbi:MAG: Uma2 family endonuclease [Polyangiaceae bacterium]